ncbi:MAG: cation:proton antiporter [Bacteroidales bacterium]|nr:cation:proton antiporter [Bacteroidales bacterium]
MIIGIIIAISLILLTAYFFELSSIKTKIPSVIFLLMLGWTIRQFVNYFNLDISNIDLILPILGTIGLILIVLEGALELEINRDKLQLTISSSTIAILSVVIISFIIGFILHWQTNVSFKICLVNAIPLAIISSAIAIPSSRFLPKNQQEFVTYESSISDIFGVILFNFLVFNENYGLSTIGNFAIQIVLMFAISAVVTIFLLMLLKNLKFHVKYIPIILFIILSYAVTKSFHLPSLLLVLILGLTLANLNKLTQLSFIRKLQPEALSSEIGKFKEILSEITFLVRSMFFTTFGFVIQAKEIINLNTLEWTLGVMLMIYLSRGLLLKFFRIPLNPIFFIAPRGLISILLFISIPSTMSIPTINSSLVVQVVVFSVLFMAIGLVKGKYKN